MTDWLEDVYHGKERLFKERDELIEKLNNYKAHELEDFMGYLKKREEFTELERILKRITR